MRTRATIFLLIFGLLLVTVWLFSGEESVGPAPDSMPIPTADILERTTLPRGAPSRRGAEQSEPPLSDNATPSHNEPFSQIQVFRGESGFSESPTSTPAPSSGPITITVTPEQLSYHGTGNTDQNAQNDSKDSSAFTLRDLESLSEREERESFNRVPGFGTRSGSISNSPSSAGAQPSPSPEQDREEEQVWYSGQARGYAMLYLMQPQALPVVESEIDILLQSRLLELYLAVLVDGTFSWRPDLLESVIRRLNQGERSLTLVLFLSNGATMRSWDSTPIDAPFVRTPPEEFREDIRFDPSTRAEFSELARRAVPLFNLNRGLNPRNTNIAVPMLEDNLDEQGFQSMYELTSEALPSYVQIVRNPCPGCYEGNGLFIFGNFVEVHGFEHLNIYPNPYGFSLDGTGFHHPDEPNPRGPPLAQIQESLLDSLARGIGYYGLWKFERQGLNETVPIKPSQRNFIPPTPQQALAEIELLRTGLNEVVLTSDMEE